LLIAFFDLLIKPIIWGKINDYFSCEFLVYG
jgi:hypothetical protein